MVMTAVIVCGGERLPVFQFLTLCHDKVSLFLNKVEPNLADLFCMFFVCGGKLVKMVYDYYSHSVCKEALIIPDHCYSAAESDS